MRLVTIGAAFITLTAACRDPLPPALAGTQSGTAPASLSYALIDLGTLGGPSSQATDINSRGQVVGFSTPGSGANHAFLWTNGFMQDLGTLGGETSVADAVNDAGQVAGRSTTGTGEWHAFVWTSGVMRDLGPAVAFGTTPVHLNNAGQAAWTAPVDSADHTHAFLWSAGAARDLGTLGGASSAAAAINDAGQVAGVADPPDQGLARAFLWTGASMRDLGNLGGRPRVTGLNRLGQVTGTTLVLGAAPQDHAWIWEGQEMLDLGVLPGDDHSDAVAINDASQVAGHCLNLGFEGGHPFRWQAGVMLPLSPTYRLDPQQYAVAMNDSGVVTGYRDVYQGRVFHAVVWENGVTRDLSASTDSLNQLSSRPAGINSRGDVVGWFTTADGRQHAALWRRGVLTAGGLLIAH
jgi:probable HAF family extracellular repeat protein